MRRLLMAMVVSIVMAAAAAGSASAYEFCTYVIIDTGHTCRHGSDHYVVGLEGKSTGTAYAQVYTTFSDGSRSSAYAISPGAGKLAYIYWAYSNRPWGYPSLHNYSSFLSRFDGWFYL